MRDLVPMEIKHFQIRELKDVIGDLLNVVEREIEPGDLLRCFHEVQGELVEAARVHQAVVRQSDHVAVVPPRRRSPLLP